MYLLGWIDLLIQNKKYFRIIYIYLRISICTQVDSVYNREVTHLLKASLHRCNSSVDDCYYDIEIHAVANKVQIVLNLGLCQMLSTLSEL